MLDPQLLRERCEWVAASLQKRGFHLDTEAFLKLESARKTLQTEVQTLQNERNQRSKSIGMAKARGDDISVLLSEVDNLGLDLEHKKKALEDILQKIEEISSGLPNIPHESVPEGTDEASNVEIRRWGVPPGFDFTARSHDELGEALEQMDFAMAVKITGSRFVVMKKNIARLHRALAQFMLDVHTGEHGYEEIYVPYIVNADSLTGTGQLPKFEEDLYKLQGGDNYYLIATSEIPITNTVRDTILPASSLPLRYTCHTPCFRSEAGSYGRDTRGMIRQHQFEKVELVWICHPEQSYDALETLTRHAEAILQKLELPYRVMALCAGDMGPSAAKTYDLEVWLPSQNTYREISSCSNTEAFQARRMKARFRQSAQEETRLVHTLNGSGLAIGRTLVAIMENYQDSEGNIHIPNILQPYMGGQTVITASAQGNQE